MDPDPNQDVNQATLALMAQCSKKAMGFQGILQGRLSKFRGPPYRAGELSFLEWLEEFDTVVEPFELSTNEKASVRYPSTWDELPRRRLPVWKRTTVLYQGGIIIEALLWSSRERTDR